MGTLGSLNHCMSCPESVSASNTRAGGAPISISQTSASSSGVTNASVMGVLTQFAFALPRVLARLAGVLVFPESLQTGQIHLPEAPTVLEPGIDRLQRRGVQLIKAVASATMFYHQARLAQQAQVLGNGWARHGKGLCDVRSEERRV